MNAKSILMGTLLTAALAWAQPPAAASKPASCPPEGFSGGFTRGCPQRQFAAPADIAAMMAAVPEKAPATPKKLRKVLVIGRATTFIHTTIPLAAKMVEYLGDKTGAWMTTITYDVSMITPDYLQQFDAIVLASTAGDFLDDPNDKPGTESRRKAFLDFVKSGKGLAGIHAATDCYHTNGKPATATAPAQPPTGTWPEFNEMIGGYFKWHWNYPTLISVKLDDPKSPLNAMFGPRGYDIIDETYTLAQDSFTRKRSHVLTSVNYNRMSNDDKAKEPAATKRTDGDYAISYVQKAGQGRVFYEAHGHDEKIYFQRPWVAHVLAGIQYALGDLEAEDAPSEK